MTESAKIFQAWDWCFGNNPYSTRREPYVYADVLVVSCSHKDFWYRDLVGQVVPNCRLRFYYRNKRTHDQYTWSDPEHRTKPAVRYPTDEIPRLHEVQVVRLTNTKIIIGNSFFIEDVIIL